MALRYYKSTIEVLVIASDESEAHDAMNEALREILREFKPESSWIDWRYVSCPQQDDGAGFEYAAAGMPKVG